MSYQTDAMIDSMYESESAQLWEDLNRVPDEQKLYDSAEYIKRAANSLDEVTDHVAEAIHYVEGTFAEDKLVSILGELESLIWNLRKMGQNFMKGVI